MLDVLIRRGSVIDGSGGPAFVADIAIEDGRIVEGDLDYWNAGVVNAAVERQRPQQDIVDVPEGTAREGQVMATYASPIGDTVGGREGTAVVFVKFFTQGDVENVDAALKSIERIALIAFGLALFIAGVSGYIVATLISRRVSRLGVAAE
ncbi:MAG: hypothetical protein NZL88_10270, partial [Gaiellaceae bacterium]|nr:hypothetical protein [Gaiellaceae bacterium]